LITALVTFVMKPDQPERPPEDTLALYEVMAPKYQKIPGLIRKYFIGNGELAGGWYEWETMDHAKAYYTPAWHQFITTTYGTDLKIEYFDCPCVIDNSSGEVCIAPEIKAAAKAAK
jgi:hypothetical protein